VLMPETGSKGAIRAIARLQEELRRNGLEAGLEKVPGGLAFSTGVACYPINAEHAELLIEEAYNALYHAKSSGRGKSYASRRQPTGEGG
jgi:diguanylate cyclase (GGDEF)-like protein